MRFGQQLSQQQKQVQKLAMTQELQQSIQILQFNTDELLSYLKDKTLENPLLDVKVTGSQADVSHYSKKVKKDSDDEESNFFAQIPDTQVSLFEYLIEQIHLNYRDTYLRQLIIFLVEFIDVNGYLSIDLEDAAEKTGADFIQMLDALTLLQQLDPAGVGARNLQECLMLQTERDDQAPELAYIVLEECFEAFAERKWKKIADKYEISLADVQTIYDYVQTLSPNPGAGYGETYEQHIYPDLIVRRENEQLEVLSTRRGQPTIRFQEEYFNRMSQTDDPEVKKYLKEKKGEFNWLQKSVQQRGDTILRIGMEIVKRQRAFFFDASRPLKPMKLKELAETLDIHESTVSRAVNGKYLETDFGVFELRSFFTNAVNPDEDGESMSSSDVKQKIKQIIDNENKNKPLSDQKILDLLKEEGIEISRRTVAKYRDVLGIPSSSNRKRYD